MTSATLVATYRIMAVTKRTSEFASGKQQQCLENWKNKCISLKVKMRLYEAIVLSTLLYCIEVWPLTATLTKRLNAAHHRWQRSILGISWKDRVTNEEVRVRTGQHSMDDILSERRLRRRLGHVIRMDHQRIPR